jgi:integrase/recombinase XerD
MTSKNESAALLAQFEQHLGSTGYTRPVTAHYVDCARRLLAHLNKHQISLTAIEPSHVNAFLRHELRTYRRRHGRSPASNVRWRQWRMAGVHKYLRVMVGRWPPMPPAANPFEAHCRHVCAEYLLELREHRNLASGTVSEHAAEAKRFLTWVWQHKATLGFATLTVSDIDLYLNARVATIRRTTRKAVSSRLRSFLQYLHWTGRVTSDLAACVIAPTLYHFEGIPSVLQPEQTCAILASASEDHSAVGLRNYAMLMLLATYGLRAGEVRRLQLEDVDWRGERLWIRHTKTGARSCLPLLPKVGQALVNSAVVGPRVALGRFSSAAMRRAAGFSPAARSPPCFAGIWPGSVFGLTANMDLMSFDIRAP